MTAYRLLALDIDGTYPVLGWVAEGMDVVDKMQPGDVIERASVWTGDGSQ